MLAKYFNALRISYFIFLNVFYKSEFETNKS